MRGKRSQNLPHDVTITQWMFCICQNQFSLKADFWRAYWNKNYHELNAMNLLPIGDLTPWMMTYLWKK